MYIYRLKYCQPSSVGQPSYVNVHKLRNFVLVVHNIELVLMSAFWHLPNPFISLIYILNSRRSCRERLCSAVVEH